MGIRILFAVGLAAALTTVPLQPTRAQEKPSTKETSADEAQKLLERAADHMQELSMRLASGEDDVERHKRPLLTFGDSARANQNGTLWAFGAEGRPLALLELYRGAEPNARWVHAVSLAGGRLVTMKTPTGVDWAPDKSQTETIAFDRAESPALRELTRLRQMKVLARRFTAHEFWDPDNSRFELRLLVAPVLRYSDAGAQIQDGAAFVLAHGTNPEVVLLIEALGKDVEAARWHYSLFRMGSAEMHVDLDGKEVWSVGRTPGVVGQRADPYWLFLSDAKPDP